MRWLQLKVFGILTVLGKFQICYFKDFKGIDLILNNFYFRFPLWVLMTTSAAYILTNLNCCINFVVYFVMYSAFRQQLREQSIVLHKRLSKNCSLIKDAVSKSIRRSSRENRAKEQIELNDINQNNCSMCENSKYIA